MYDLKIVGGTIVDGTGNARFAYDSYRRLIQMFGTVVLGIRDEPFEDVLASYRDQRGVSTDADLTGDDLGAIVEAFKNTTDAVWLEMPSLYPNNTNLDFGANYPGPFTSIGDFRIFPNHLVLGIGVADPSHIKDPTKQRSSGDEFGAEVLRRMLKPFGW